MSETKNGYFSVQIHQTLKLLIRLCQRRPTTQHHAASWFVLPVRKNENHVAFETSLPDHPELFAQQIHARLTCRKRMTLSQREQDVFFKTVNYRSS